MLRFGRSPAIFVIFLLCFPGFSYGQYPWSSVLSSSRAINWSNVGAPNINNARTQCVTSACNTVSNGTTVTAASINAALASAPANTYVLLPSGTFSMSATIVVESGSGTTNGNVTLRGGGANSTFLVFSGQGSSYSYCAGFDICAASSDTNNAGSGAQSNTANWTAGYSAGATSITLNSVSGRAPAVGQPIILDQIDNQQDNGALYVGCEIGTNSAQQVGSPPYGDYSGACAPYAHANTFERGDGALASIRGQQQIVNVTSISGSGTGPYTVGISPALYAPNWNSGQSPGAWWATNPIYNVGFEDFSITTSVSAGGIYFFNCQGCWIKGVQDVQNPNTTGIAATAVLSICNQCTVRDSYFYGNGVADNYVIAVQIGSDILEENNISQFPSASQFYNSDCEGCVATYNFSVNPVYGGSSNFLIQSSDTHGIQLFALSEGNIGAGLYADSFHGTHVLNTQFRNRWDGREQNNGKLTSSATTPLILSSGARYNNAIANVLGTPGYHTYYKSLPPGTNLSLSIIGAGTYPDDDTNDGLVNPTSMFWGNWDTVTNAARWCGDSSDPGWSTTCGGVSEVPATINVGAPFLQQIGTGNGSTRTFSGTLANTPLVPGNSSAFLGPTGTGNSQTAIYANDQGNGTFANTGSTSGALLGTINYTTGAVSLTFASAPASGVPVYVNYLQQTSLAGAYSNFVPSSTTLPPSFVYSSTPSWWPSSKPWPNIGPDVTGGNVGQCSGGTYDSSETISSQSSQCSVGGGTFSTIGGGVVVSNPAMDCYFNVMGGNPNGTGSVLIFNAASCYPPGPIPPTGLVATVN